MIYKCNNTINRKYIFGIIIVIKLKCLFKNIFNNKSY